MTEPRWISPDHAHIDRTSASIIVKWQPISLDCRAGSAAGIMAESRKEPRTTTMTEEIIIHRAPRQNWYATQDAARGVLICNRASEDVLKVEPPP